MITLIAAVARNRAIGLQNHLLYRLPADLRRFKALTSGHTVVMGRRTFESLPKGALPDRRNIVLTHNTAFTAPGIEVFPSLEAALAACTADEEVFIIGGESVYREAMPLAQRLCLTLIDDTPTEADAFFPEWDEKEWQLTSDEPHASDDRHSVAYRFADFCRFLSLLIVALLLSASCTTGNRAADTMNGASVGAMFGGALGGILGGHRGHDWGTMVGLIAGGAVGHAASAASDANREARQSRREERTGIMNRSERRTVERQTTSPLTLQGLRFISGQDAPTSTIHRGETCQLIFELANRSGQAVYSIVPYICEVEGNEHLHISPSTRIESLSAGDAIRYTAVVRADKSLKAGQAVLRIAVSCDEGDFVTLYDFPIETAK